METIIHEALFEITDGQQTLLKKGEEFEVASFTNEGVFIDCKRVKNYMITFDVFKLATRAKTVHVSYAGYVNETINK